MQGILKVLLEFKIVFGVDLASLRCCTCRKGLGFEVGMYWFLLQVYFGGGPSIAMFAYVVLLARRLISK